MVGTQRVYFEAVPHSSSDFMGSPVFCVTTSRLAKGKKEVLVFGRTPSLSKKQIISCVLISKIGVA